MIVRGTAHRCTGEATNAGRDWPNGQGESGRTVYQSRQLDAGPHAESVIAGAQVRAHGALGAVEALRELGGAESGGREECGVALPRGERGEGIARVLDIRPSTHQEDDISSIVRRRVVRHQCELDGVVAEPERIGPTGCTNRHCGNPGDQVGDLSHQVSGRRGCVQEFPASVDEYRGDGEVGEGDLDS